MLEVREKMSSEQHVTAPFAVSFDRDLENARVLIEESPWKENPQKYRKVAEGIVRRVLSFDPANEYAKRLLDKMNNANSCNSSNVCVVAADDGAAIAALWLAS